MTNSIGYRTVPVELGFPTADGEEVQITYKNQFLTVAFAATGGGQVCFQCHDTLGFRWQEAEYLVDSAEQYDNSCELIGSPWLEEHKKQGLPPDGIEFHHYKLNFNGCGVLEILCSKIVNKKSKQ